MPFPRFLRWLSVALLAGLFVMAAWARFRLPQTPLADPDVWCYVNPGLSRLLGGPFQHTYGQCFLYPGFIYLVLAACGDWRMITVAQHLSGLGTGALLLVAWRQVRGFLPKPRVPRFLYDVAGLGMARVFLLSLSPIRFEHTLRPEAVFPFFALLNVCANLAFIRHRFGGGGADRRQRSSETDWWGLTTGAGAVFTGVLVFLLKPSFSAALLLASVPVGLSLFRAGSSRRDKLTLAVVSVLAPGVLLLWPEQHFRRGDPDSHVFLAVSLFTVHAGLIRDQMTADVAQRRTAPYDPAWTDAVRARLAREIQDSTVTKKYPSLGYDPDYLKRETSFHGWFVEQLRSREQAANFYDDYYRRTWRGRPLAMGGKIWREMRLFYRFGRCPAYREYEREDLKPGYAESATIFDPGAPWFNRQHPTPESALAKVNRYPPAREYLARCAGLAGASLVVANAPWVDAATDVLSPTYLPLLGWALLLGAGAYLLPGVRRWAGLSVTVLLLLYADNFGTTLSLSVGHAMDVGRYSTYQLAFTLLPQCVSALLAVEAALAVGAFLAVRYRPLLAARPEAWPAPVLPQGRELAVGRLGSGQEDGNGDVFLALDGEPADADPAETARRLVQAYREAPADLITVRRAAGSGLVARWLRWAVGADPGSLGAGGRLLSGRLHRCVARGASSREIAVRAAGGGFVIREILPPEGSGAFDHVGTTPRRGEGWRLFALCCRCRPWRVLGAVAAVCLLLAAGIALSSRHHPPHARHRYVLRRGAVTVAGGLAVVAVGCVVTAGVLEARRRRWRAEFLPRAGN